MTLRSAKQQFTMDRNGFAVPRSSMPAGNFRTEAQDGWHPDVEYFGEIGLMALACATAGCPDLRRTMAIQGVLHKPVTANNFLDIGFDRVLSDMTGREAELAANGASLVAASLAITKMMERATVRPHVNTGIGGAMIGEQYRLDINNPVDPNGTYLEGSTDRRAPIARILHLSYVRSFMVTVGFLAERMQPVSPAIRLTAMSDTLGCVTSSLSLTVCCDEFEGRFAASAVASRVEPDNSKSRPDGWVGFNKLGQFAHAILLAANTAT